MISFRSIFAVGLLLLPACSSAPRATAPLQYSASRTTSAEAGDAAKVRIRADAGALNVNGRDDLSEVRVDGTARTSRNADLGDVQVDVRRVGDEVLVTTQVPKGNRKRRARLDLTVEVPHRLAAEIRDGNGDLSVQNLTGKMIVEDGNGDRKLRGVGSTRIDDSNGDIEVRDTSGGLTLKDSNGDIFAEAIDGGVQVTTDSNGDIRLSDITGNVLVMDDENGDIVVDRIGGDFIVEEDGNGSINHSGVEGGVWLPEDD